MTNDQTAKLAKYGIDYAEAMERFGGNEVLFVRLASKYADDPHFDALEAAMTSGDTAAAEREAHSLKGVAGNLSFVSLYDLAARITDALRADDFEKRPYPHAGAPREPRSRVGSPGDSAAVGATSVPTATSSTSSSPADVVSLPDR